MGVARGQQPSPRQTVQTAYYSALGLPQSPQLAVVGARFPLTVKPAGRGPAHPQAALLIPAGREHRAKGLLVVLTLLALLTQRAVGAVRAQQGLQAVLLLVPAVLVLLVQSQVHLPITLAAGVAAALFKVQPPAQGAQAAVLRAVLEPEMVAAQPQIQAGVVAVAATIPTLF